VRTRAAADRRPTSAEGVLEAFLEELRRRRYSTSLLDQAQQVLPRLLSHLREKRVRDLRGVTEVHLDAYARDLAASRTRYGRPPSWATQRIHLSLIRRFFRFLCRRRWMLADPTQDLRLPRSDSLPRTVLSLSQARQLMNAVQRFHGRWWWSHVETRDHAILELLYGTGIRKGECVRLDVADLDLLQAELLVRNGKGRKDRLVPIPARAALALDLYLREARPAFVKDYRIPALFTSWQGERLKPVTLVALLKRRAQAARLRVPLSAHVLRHTCATHLLQGGADVRHVQELLGHAHLDSTMRYTRVAVKDLAAVLERCHPRERDWERRRPERVK
jgi:integrase/recombinase XerD